MNRYRAIFGVYVRMYADHEFDAASDEAATARAIEEFKKQATEFDWTDADYDNLAQPSIVGLQDVKLGHDIVEGHDFAACAADACDNASDDLLTCLKEVLIEIDGEIAQRRTSGNGEEWTELQAKADRARAAIKNAETV